MPDASRPGPAPRLRTWHLFAACVLVWGTTWHVITWQLADLGAAAGVALRFALAGTLLLALAAWRGDAARFDRRTHAVLALQGVFLYGVSYVCVYHAERHVASGLVAVAYAASPLLGGVGAAVVFGTPVGRRFALGGVAAVVGVALVFWPELERPVEAGKSGALGTAFAVSAVLLSTVGALVSSRNRARGIALFPAMGWGMLYGAIAALLIALASGEPIGLPTTWPSWAALAWLAIGGSIVTFAAFLTLQERVGVGAAGTVGAMTPLVALAVSVALEGLGPTPLVLAGAAIAVAGNALMLWRAKAEAVRRDAAAAE